MGWQYVLDGGFRILEEAVGGHGFGMSTAGGGNAEMRILAQILQNFDESFVKSFIVEIDGFEFVCDPILFHLTSCLVHVFSIVWLRV